MAKAGLTTQSSSLPLGFWTPPTSARELYFTAPLTVLCTGPPGFQIQGWQGRLGEEKKEEGEESGTQGELEGCHWKPAAAR